MKGHSNINYLSKFANIKRCLMNTDCNNSPTLCLYIRFK